MRTKNDLQILSKELFQLEISGEYGRAIESMADIWADTSAFPIIGDADPAVAAEILLRCGSLLGSFGQVRHIPSSQEQSKNLLSEGRRRYLELGDFEKVAECENYLALAYVRTGEFDEASTWLDESMTRDLSPDNRTRLHTLLTRTLIQLRSEQYDQVIDEAREVEPMISSSNDCFLIGSYSTNLGVALRNSGRIDEALDRYAIAKKQHTILGHRLYLGTIENNIAFIYKSEGRFAEAHEAVENALIIYDSLEDWNRKGSSLDTKAQILFEEGRYKKALLAVEEALDILSAGENSAYLTEAYFTKAKILVFLDDIAPATLSLTTAIEIARKNIGEKAAEKIAKEFEIVIRKKSARADSHTHIPHKLYEGEIELILPPSIANYDDYQVVRIKNSHLEEIGIRKDSLAVVVEETIKRCDLVAVTEIANDSIICGFYDYFAGIVSVSGINSETLLFKTEEVKVVGKIIGVGDKEPGPDGKIQIRPIEI